MGEGIGIGSKPCYSGRLAPERVAAFLWISGRDEGGEYVRDLSFGVTPNNGWGRFNNPFRESPRSSFFKKMASEDLTEAFSEILWNFIEHP